MDRVGRRGCGGAHARLVEWFRLRRTDGTHRRRPRRKSRPGDRRGARSPGRGASAYRGRDAVSGIESQCRHRTSRNACAGGKLDAREFVQCRPDRELRDRSVGRERRRRALGRSRRCAPRASIRKRCDSRSWRVSRAAISRCCRCADALRRARGPRDCGTRAQGGGSAGALWRRLARSTSRASRRRC